MRNIGEIIEQEIRKKNLVRKELCEQIGIIPQHLAKVLRDPKMDCILLEKFCQALELDPADFFDYRPENFTYGTKVGEIRQRVGRGDASVNFGHENEDLMRELIKEKDARISTLESTIETLKNVMFINGLNGQNPGTHSGQNL